jgi:ABC-type branched-subunit amino acid transport system ATPase component
MTMATEQDAPLLSVRDLDVRFGALVAVSGVSFHVGANEAVGLVGPNGAGKTTTFNTISGMQPPTAGRIAFNGRDITGLPPEKIAQAGITRTFQNVRLFADLSVFDNVMMGSYAADQCGVLAAMMRLGRHARMEARAREQARHWIARLGLAPYADLSAATLPLGLQRIAEVARALAGNPRLVLLDEPAAGLNGAEKTRLAELLRDAMQESGCALLLIEHDMSLVMGLVDRIVVLDFGRKLADGSPADIANNPDVIRVYLGV